MGLNCWEFMRCGREVGGKNTEKLGVCPVSPEPYMHPGRFGCAYTYADHNLADVPIRT